MKKVTKDEFYAALWAEKKDVIHGECTHHSHEYYPYTRDFVYRHSSNKFGAIKDLGYVNGKPESEFYLNN